MSNSVQAPDTIVLIHGFWVTPRSWEHWITHYEAKGFRVIAPAYPGFEAEVESLNADPSPVEHVTVAGIMERLVNVCSALDRPPILMGHSAGGVFTQLLLDRGIGAVGVAINSAPPEGVLVVPLTQLKAAFPVFKSPANRHKAIGLTLEQWRYAFTNTFTDEATHFTHKRYAVPASGRIFWDNVLANFIPGPQETAVNFGNESRAPLLFQSGALDHLMPPSVQQSNAKHYSPKTITEVKVYEGRAHLMPAQHGWEEVADDALEWALRHAQSPQMA